MLLVHKPHHPSSSFFMSSTKLTSPQFHRRNPSAPAAVAQVLPTRTPGLLSLSKPTPRPTSTSPSHPRQSTPRPPKSKPTPTPPLLGTPEKTRGRSTPAKDKIARNSSKSRNGTGRGRQPSPPPISLPDQFSDSDAPAASNPSNSIISKPTTPVLTAPSGRLAKRRNRNSTPIPNSPSPATKVKRSPSPIKVKGPPAPLPIAKNPRTSSVMPLSRSVPIPTLHPSRAHLRRTATDSEADPFPVCDDNDSDAEPTTPVRASGATVTWKQSNGFDSDESDNYVPHTAPLSSHTQTARHYFPSPVPSPTPSPRRSAHARAPSYPTDTLFNLSFDSSSDNDLNMESRSDDMRALFGLLPNRRRQGINSARPASASGTPITRRGTAYASSTFQNSPSPEALPAPSFSFAAERLAFQHRQA